ncbi:hypothetical protein V9T40_008274 [Parthenolecanium corni]|uniref:Uncharacterized protein n=1 Tax=Parthenolecanium corni TaxID=536013 RepID=A0AAN9TZR5_9HEMI
MAGPCSTRPIIVITGIILLLLLPPPPSTCIRRGARGWVKGEHKPREGELIRPGLDLSFRGVAESPKARERSPPGVNVNDISDFYLPVSAAYAR